ncbi:type II toxin-antitoxin system HipA family toxin [Nonomuraea sp. NPDC059007]|uniref:type II toxin-antitoxin system HipA family toxin n=1 Tax=Nonomuraea sp. NPDC059007 TaxID=3346692 RepID=UPI003699035A
MTPSEVCHGVWLGAQKVGLLRQRGDYTWFEFCADYLADPGRPVLGLHFEQNLQARRASALRLPPWFSNLLPEGRLREWVAEDRGVSVEREMELLAQVGHDLPGAVRVLPDESQDSLHWELVTHDNDAPAHDDDHPGWRFSLAGVMLKFSMLREGDRLTLPGSGEGGDWIVKLPDRVYPDVPLNEFAMMSLAKAAGIEVPEVRLVHRDQIEGLPPNVWPVHEEWAYAIQRFDRSDDGGRIHIEDLAQVRGIYSDRKYVGNYETVASLVYRRRDVKSLQEFARRLAFSILISNGDMHLKNWSLIYRDPRIPVLAPAYDFVATDVYRDEFDPETLGLNFGKTKLFDRISVRTFARLQEKLFVPEAQLPDVVAEMVERVVDEWPRAADTLASSPLILERVAKSIEVRSKSLLHSR